MSGNRLVVVGSGVMLLVLLVFVVLSTAHYHRPNQTKPSAATEHHREQLGQEPPTPSPASEASPTASSEAMVTPKPSIRQPAVLGAATSPVDKVPESTTSPEPPLDIWTGDSAAANVTCEQSQITMGSGYVNVDANPRPDHQAGIAEAYVDFNDGTSSPLEQIDVPANYPAWGIYVNGPTPFHVYSISPYDSTDILKYRIRVVEPNQMTTNWMGWGNICPNRHPLVVEP